MRITTGKYKGHLTAFTAQHLRPTTDRVKQTLFNILASQVEQARVLDLFAGTGSLGFEALSRGARELVCVEQHRQSLEILRKNLAKLKIQEPCDIQAQSVFSFLESYQGPAFDLIFADPPFTEAIADKVMLAIASAKVFHPTTIISIESARREKMGDDYPPLCRYDVRAFSDKSLSFFTLQGEGS